MGGVIITLENLFDNYKKFEKIAKKKNGENEIDLRDLELNPTTLLLFWFFEREISSLGFFAKSFAHPLSTGTKAVITLLIAFFDIILPPLSL